MASLVATTFGCNCLSDCNAICFNRLPAAKGGKVGCVSKSRTTRCPRGRPEDYWPTSSSVSASRIHQWTLPGHWCSSQCQMLIGSHWQAIEWAHPQPHTYPQTKGSQIDDNRLSTSFGIVERPDHHCGDDLCFWAKANGKVLVSFDSKKAKYCRYICAIESTIWLTI